MGRITRDGNRAGTILALLVLAALSLVFVHSAFHHHHESGAQYEQHDFCRLLSNQAMAGPELSHGSSAFPCHPFIHRESVLAGAGNPGPCPGALHHASSPPTRTSPLALKSSLII